MKLSIKFNQDDFENLSFPFNSSKVKLPGEIEFFKKNPPPSGDEQAEGMALISEYISNAYLAREKSSACSFLSKWHNNLDTQNPFVEITGSTIEFKGEYNSERESNFTFLNMHLTEDLTEVIPLGDGEFVLGNVYDHYLANRLSFKTPNTLVKPEEGNPGVEGLRRKTGRAFIVRTESGDKVPDSLKSGVGSTPLSLETVKAFITYMKVEGMYKAIRESSNMNLLNDFPKFLAQELYLPFVVYYVPKNQNSSNFSESIILDFVNKTKNSKIGTQSNSDLSVQSAILELWRLLKVLQKDARVSIDTEYWLSAMDYYFQTLALMLQASPKDIQKKISPCIIDADTGELAPVSFSGTNKTGTLVPKESVFSCENFLTISTYGLDEGSSDYNGVDIRSSIQDTQANARYVLASNINDADYNTSAMGDADIISLDFENHISLENNSLLSVIQGLSLIDSFDISDADNVADMSQFNMADPEEASLYLESVKKVVDENFAPVLVLPTIGTDLGNKLADPYDALAELSDKIDLGKKKWTDINAEMPYQPSSDLIPTVTQTKEVIMSQKTIVSMRKALKISDSLLADIIKALP